MDPLSLSWETLKKAAEALGLMILILYLLNRIFPLNHCASHKGALCGRCTLTYFLLTLWVMNFPLSTGGGAQLDLRLVPLTLAGFYGGPRVGFTVGWLSFFSQLALGREAGAFLSVLDPLYGRLAGNIGRKTIGRKGKKLAPLLLAIAALSNGLLFYGSLWMGGKLYPPLATLIPFQYPLLGAILLGLWLGHEILGGVTPQSSPPRSNASVTIVPETKDDLTGILNHRSFQERLVQLVEESHQQRAPLSLLFVDLDHFDRFNRRQGYQAGDHILQELAHILKEKTRGHDIVARYGGEEFAVILPGVEPTKAMEIAERMAVIVARHTFGKVKGGPGRKITVSVGVGSLTGGEDKDQLIRKAEQALQKAKGAGGNCARN